MKPRLRAESVMLRKELCILTSCCLGLVILNHPTVNQRHIITWTDNHATYNHATNDPTVWTFLQGIEKDLQMQRTAFLQGIASAQSSVPKRYKELKVRVQNTVHRYLSSEILVYLRAIAHFSYSRQSRATCIVAFSRSAFNELQVLCVL